MDLLNAGKETAVPQSEGDNLQSTNHADENVGSNNSNQEAAISKQPPQPFAATEPSQVDTAQGSATKDADGTVGVATNPEAVPTSQPSQSSAAMEPSKLDPVQDSANADADGNAGLATNQEAVSTSQPSQLSAATEPSKVDPAQGSATAAAENNLCEPLLYEPRRATPMPAKGRCSDRKLAANRANSRNSTGPRTPEGKARSARNALKHGALARKVLYNADGTLADHDLAVLAANLVEEYGCESTRAQVLIEAFIVAYRRKMATVDLENQLMQDKRLFVRLGPEADRLQRYATANQRAIVSLLDKLEEVKQEKAARAAQGSAEPRGISGAEELAGGQAGDGQYGDEEEYEEESDEDEEMEFVPDPSLPRWGQFEQWELEKEDLKFEKARLEELKEEIKEQQRRESIWRREPY